MRHWLLSTSLNTVHVGIVQTRDKLTGNDSPQTAKEANNFTINLLKLTK